MPILPFALASVVSLQINPEMRSYVEASLPSIVQQAAAYGIQKLLITCEGEELHDIPVYHFLQSPTIFQSNIIRS